MSPLSVSIVRLRALARGQTMAEYALILATIALISVAFYNTGGTIINSLVNNVSSLL